MKVEAIYVAPVKSLGLSRLERAEVTPRGIAGDRAFIIVYARGRVLTQRECAPMTRIVAAYDITADRLRLEFPDGAVESNVVTGGTLEGSFYGSPIKAKAVAGPFDDKLSVFAGQPLRLAKVDEHSHAFDAHPLSMCTAASVAHLRSIAAFAALDERRFRQNVYVSGASLAHEEDSWIGRNVRIGGATVGVLMRDSRCVITTHDPDTGETDIDTLKMIASYRTDQPKEVNFGVYCDVVTPGAIAVGDDVVPSPGVEEAAS
ncbi:MAG: MOSC N-terminal beta barrel domain-containing protein [Dehalococcoidia bacterium]